MLVLESEVIVWFFNIITEKIYQKQLRLNAFQ